MSWIAGSTLILGAVIVTGFVWYERTHPTTRVLALVATLAAMAALGRVAFAALPNVKPTTDIVLIAGYALGGAPGFMVGAVAALASNLFFGQGPWTPWQMVAWGGVGLFGAALARFDLKRIPLALVCGAAGLGFGTVMNLYLWVTFSGDHTAAKLAATVATSLPFDLAHALGNVVFALAFGPALIRALRRYRTRFEITWAPLVTVSDRSASRTDSSSAPSATAASAARQAAANMAPNGPLASTDAIGSSAPGDGWGSDSIRANPARSA
jgi:energy-coupling factor transport system substrate-specific component